jgi:hypothetical protein
MLSHKILGSVSYKNRLPAGRLKPPLGIIPGDVRSLPELHQFLSPDDAFLPGINLKALSEWIGGVIGDRELADSVQKIVNASVSYVEGCVKVYEVVGYRLDQARRTIKEAK